MQSPVRMFISRSLCEAVGRERTQQRWVKMKERKSLGVVYGLDAIQARRSEMDESGRLGCSEAKWRQGEINEEQIYEGGKKIHK